MKKRISSFFIINNNRFYKNDIKVTCKESNRLHTVIASEIKEGLDLTFIADATKSRSTGKSNPDIKVTQMLEYVNGIKDFTRRIPIELLADTKQMIKTGMNDIPNLRNLEAAINKKRK